MNIPVGQTCRRCFYDGYTFPVKRSHGAPTSTTNRTTTSQLRRIKICHQGAVISSLLRLIDGNVSPDLDSWVQHAQRSYLPSVGTFVPFIVSLSKTRNRRPTKKESFNEACIAHRSNYLSNPIYPSRHVLASPPSFGTSRFSRSAAGLAATPFNPPPAVAAVVFRTIIPLFILLRPVHVRCPVAILVSSLLSSQQLAISSFRSRNLTAESSTTAHLSLTINTRAGKNKLIACNRRARHVTNIRSNRRRFRYLAQKINRISFACSHQNIFLCINSCIAQLAIIFYKISNM